MAKPKLLIDSNILIDGILSNWSASKALLILFREVQLFDVYISELSIQEIEYFLVSKGKEQFIEDYLKYIELTNIKILPLPDQQDVVLNKDVFLPVLKHLADLPIVITAIQHEIDWIISNNRDHFNDALAEKLNIKINSASEFLKEFEITG